ncbi:MAG: Hsp20/alpha crystallin family protein [Fimbriimonadaceae bacterium]
MRRRKDVEDLFWPAASNLQKLSVEMVQTRMTITARRFWQPQADLIEDPSFLILKVDLAGTRIEDVHLGYLADSHAITIRGHRPECDPEGSQRIGIYQLEIYYGDFERVIALPRIAIDVERIEAALFEGILTVLIPKV